MINHYYIVSPNGEQVWAGRDEWRAMSKVMTKGCACDQLDDDLMAEGWTCYACYEADNE